MSLLKNFLIRSFIVFIVLGLTFGLLEVLMRTVFVSQVAQGKEWEETYVSLNSLGFRDIEHSLEKPDNIFRVIIFGDSLSFGSWVNRFEDIFPRKLEKYLNQGLNRPRFEVLNFSGPGGWRTGDEMYSFFNTGIRYKPDLVIIALSPNDIPLPEHYGQYEKESAFQSYIGFLERRLADKSILFRFLYNAKNAMWVQIGFNPSYLEYLAERFNNRGWEMQKIYFDYFYHFSRIHKTHFSIGIIPYAIQLDDNYPLLPGISKVMNYCESRNLLCVDIFKNGFKNEDPTSFATYPNDPHFNEKGHEITSRVIYDKLAPLKKYKKLSKFHKAFNFTELINGQWFVEELDRNYDQIIPDAAPTLLKSDGATNQELKVWKDSTNLYLQRTYSDKFSSGREIVEIITLNNKGEFVQSNKKAIDLKFQNTTQLQSHLKENGKYILRENKKETNLIFPDVIFKEREKGNVFFVSRKKPNRITLGPSIGFIDPLVLERKIFRGQYDLIGKKDSEENWFTILNSFYSWPNYFNSFIAEILIEKPSLSFLIALKRTYLIRKDQEKLGLLIAKYPHLNLMVSSSLEGITPSNSTGKPKALPNSR
jgi:lysophospholipase L1-like esterase